MRKSALILLICAGPALAGVHSVPRDEPLIAVRIPETWKVQDHEEYIEATTPDGTIHLLVLPVEGRKVAESMGEGVRHIRNTGGIVIKRDSGKKESTTLRGKPVQSLSWEGHDQKNDVKIHCHVVPGKADKPVLVFFWGPVEANKKYQRELNQILQTTEAP